MLRWERNNNNKKKKKKQNEWGVLYLCYEWHREWLWYKNETCLCAIKLGNGMHWTSRTYDDTIVI